MKDSTYDRLFDTTENLANIALARRRAAIDGSKNLIWSVFLRTDDGALRELQFRYAPEHDEIERGARALGVERVLIESIVVARAKRRPAPLHPRSIGLRALGRVVPRRV